MTRNEKIDEVLHEIADYWKQYPNLRLGQLIANAVSPEVDMHHLFAIDDNTLIKKLSEQQYSTVRPVSKTHPA